MHVVNNSFKTINKILHLIVVDKILNELNTAPPAQ